MTYRKLSVAALPVLLATAQPWSLFNPKIHAAHYAGLRQLLEQAGKLPRHAAATDAPPAGAAHPRAEPGAGGADPVAGAA